MGRTTTAGIQAEIAKGVFRPHTALTNLALSYYQNASNYFAKAIFPVCPVGLSSDNYYIFDKEQRAGSICRICIAAIRLSMNRRWPGYIIGKK